MPNNLQRWVLKYLLVKNYSLDNCFFIWYLIFRYVVLSFNGIYIRVFVFSQPAPAPHLPVAFHLHTTNLASQKSPKNSNVYVMNSIFRPSTPKLSTLDLDFQTLDLDFRPSTSTFRPSTSTFGTSTFRPSTITQTLSACIYYNFLYHFFI